MITVKSDLLINNTSRQDVTPYNRYRDDKWLKVNIQGVNTVGLQRSITDYRELEFVLMGVNSW